GLAQRHPEDEDARARLRFRDDEIISPFGEVRLEAGLPAAEMPRLRLLFLLGLLLVMQLDRVLPEPGGNLRQEQSEHGVPERQALQAGGTPGFDRLARVHDFHQPKQIDQGEMVELAVDSWNVQGRRSLEVELESLGRGSLPGQRASDQRLFRESA